jgi:hypothetical protein
MSNSDQEYKTYIGSYRHQGSEWSFEIQATSREDAEKRLMAIACNGRIDGEVVLKVELKENRLPAWTKKLFDKK